MAIASYRLIEALRETAQNLQNGAPYAWGHHGQCNCGNLAQVLTDFTETEIQAYAQTGAGEWTEIATQYCPISGMPVDMLVAKLMDAGLNPTDLHHLEYLNDKKVLQYLDGGFRWLRRNQRADAIDYFEAYANMLESKMLDAAVIEALIEVVPEPLVMSI